MILTIIFGDNNFHAHFKINLLKNFMNLSFANYKISHLIALSAAFAIHGAIVAASMLPSNPIVINQQAIQVSFVAPNSQNNRNETVSHEKSVVKDNGIKQKKENGDKAEKKSEMKAVAGKQTSGRSDPNAVATRAAESDPVFDAAYLNNPAPYYPEAAKRKGAQGKVLINVTVKIDGTPLMVAIASSSGSSILDEAALDAVKQWRFIPAKRGGELVQANVIVPVEFKMI